ncbi:hypothetical protein BJ944DRAFT_235173 [Cunninghamella echinulata]|nr:hypothetical protein BJ944DRAFT_235173 [Cunninghamella echinulata]
MSSKKKRKKKKKKSEKKKKKKKKKKRLISPPIQKNQGKKIKRTENQLAQEYVFKEIKEYNIDENEDGDFDFADNNAIKVTTIIGKVMVDNNIQSNSNVLINEYALKILIKDITEDDLDKLFQIPWVHVCTVNAFLDNIIIRMKL